MHVQTPEACLQLLQRPNACWQLSKLVPGHNKTLQTDKAFKTFQASEPVIGCIQCFWLLLPQMTRFLAAPTHEAMSDAC